MKELIFFLLLIITGAQLLAQPDTLKRPAQVNADDPSQFLTRMEFYNELQYYGDKDVYLNQTVLRNVIKIGKRFTTRIDVPFVYNSLTTPTKIKQSGIGDISFRLLGFKVFETKKSAFTASIEISMNTAQSDLLGTGKNLIIPVVTYTSFIPAKKLLLSLALQQTNSISGDDQREDVNFTKLQFVMIRYFSKKTWLVLAPEWFADYVNGGISMNLRSRLAHAPNPRINIWITPSVGVFGTFRGRYDWSADVGGRYFLLRQKK